MKNKVIKAGGCLWWVKSATSKKTAKNAILMALVTGSVGGIEETKNADPPFEDGKRLAYADVQRIKVVKPL